MDSKIYYNRITAPEHINRQIIRYKKACFKHIGKFPSQDSTGHISFNAGPLTSALNHSTMLNVDEYYRYVENRIKRIPSIMINIIGFEYLPHGKFKGSICAALRLDQETINWFNIVMDVLSPGQKIRHPHITIARNISVESFKILWPHFQKLEYQDTFRVEYLDILQQEIGNGYRPMLPFIKIPFGS